MIPKKSWPRGGHVKPGLLRGNQQPAEAAPSPLRPRLARIDIGQGLTVGVFDFIAARYLLDSPWRGEAAGHGSPNRQETTAGEVEAALMTRDCSMMGYWFFGHARSSPLAIS